MRKEICILYHSSFLAKYLQIYLSMDIHHNKTLDSSHVSYKNKVSLSNVDRELKLGELRLRYVKLMRDIHSSLGQEDAGILINELEEIWDKLTYPKA